MVVRGIFLSSWSSWKDVTESLGGGVLDFGFDEHGFHDAVGGIVAQAEGQQCDHDVEDGISGGDGFGVEAVDEEVGHGDHAGAAEPRLGKPIKGREEEGLQLQPHARDALGVDLGGHGGGGVGVGGVAEVEEELEGAAHLRPPR